MTSKLTQQATEAGTDEKFPDFPPRDDMQNSIHLDDQAHQGTLRRHFGTSNSIIVLSEVPLRLVPNQQQGHRIPDLLIAFNVDRSLAVTQNGYSISAQGKPPEFVLEIASRSTGREDYIAKRTDYASFGVMEYWRFDPTGGSRHDTHLAGDWLVDGEYQPIGITQVGQTRFWGHSEVLNLDLCWEEGQLRWWDPATGHYLLTFDETDEARVNAEARVRELEAELARRDTEG